MISFLSWKVFDLEFWKCNILTNSWVWYEVNINDLTFSKLELWSEANLYIYHNITENNQSLYGFVDKDEKSLFIEFTKISWVWWRSALNLLDLWINNIFDAIKREDTHFFTEAKWIWKKMAEKVILELKDKDFIKTSITNIKSNTNNGLSDLDRQIKISLVSMWYDSYKIDEILKDLPSDINDMGEIIKYVIKNI